MSVLFDWSRCGGVIASKKLRQLKDLQFDDTVMIFNDFNEQERVRIVGLVDDKVLVSSTSNVEEFKQFFTDHSLLKRVFQVKNVCQMYPPI